MVNISMKHLIPLLFIDQAGELAFLINHILYLLMKSDRCPGGAFHAASFLCAIRTP